jgi:hypothetical protein
MTRTFHTPLVIPVPPLVIPAQAGTHLHTTRHWVPAFAGMTDGEKRTTP